MARWVTELDYARFARRTAKEVAGYVGAGFDVVAVVGVGASPSCGVVTTLDLDSAVAAMARPDRRTLSPAVVDERSSPPT